MTAMMCKNKCCKATYCPLALSFAKTCHTFQGQSAGPVSHGQQPNAVDRVVVDPGDKGMEGKNPGLLYMAVSRATTIGDPNNNHKHKEGGRRDSAIYFTGHNMTRNRVLNLTLKKDGSEYQRVQLRRKWTSRVEKNTVGMQLAQGETPETVLDWCKRFRASKDTLERAVSNKSWRKNLDRDLNY